MNKPQMSYQRAFLTIFAISFLGFIFVLWINYLYPIFEKDIRVWECFIIFYLLVLSLWFALFIGFNGLNMVTVKVGIILSIFSAIMDLFYPSYAVGLDGSIATGDTVGYKGSIDYTLGYYCIRFGLSGSIVFILTYLVLPIVFLIAILLIIKPKMFMHTIKDAV